MQFGVLVDGHHQLVVFCFAMNSELIVGVGRGRTAVSTPGQTQTEEEQTEEGDLDLTIFHLLVLQNSISTPRSSVGYTHLMCSTMPTNFDFIQ